MKCGLLIAVWLASAACAAWAVATPATAAPTAAPAGGVTVESSEPRAYGYQVGDVLQRQLTLHAAPGWVLDETSLPRTGARGQALELRHLALRTQPEGAGQRHLLALEYQVFIAPTAVRTLEIAPWRLRFKNAARVEEVRIEAWPVTVAPLVPVDVSPRRGLGDLQPDRLPALMDTAAARNRLLVCALAAVLLGVWLGAVYIGPPWRAARSRPFGRAWQQLRRLPPNADVKQWREACKQMHDALNLSAGEVLFEAGLPRYLAARPGLALLQGDLARFLQLSRRTFFADGSPAPGDAAWLLALSKRLRNAERGSA
jgi:mxaA protein